MIVVRIQTYHYRTKRGFAKRRELSFMWRQCQLPEGHNFLDYDADMIGVDEVIDRITNFDEVKDGLYSVEIVNESHDWETPHIVDDYDYKLTPIK